MYNPFKVDEHKKAAQEADILYQLSEQNGEIWITHNGYPAVPESLLKKPALESLLEIRELYVKSKLKEK